MAEPSRAPAPATSSTPIVDVALGEIDPPSAPLRSSFDSGELDRLADDMARRGLLQPIGLVPSLAGRAWEVVWGHRRFLAAQRLGWATIAARVFPAGTSVIEARIAENEIRDDLSPVDQGRFCADLRAAGYDDGRIARVVRRSEDWVRARVELLEYPEELRDAVGRRAIALTVARELAMIDHEPTRREYLDEALRTGANARTVSVWRAAYQADRDRIVSNAITRDEILARRETLRVMACCEYCLDEVPVEETRIFRFCAGCARELLQVIQEARRSAGASG